MRLTLKSIQEQAQKAGHTVERISNGYTLNGQKFRLLSEIVDHLNRCLDTHAVPDLTLRETQQLAQKMGFLITPMQSGYGIFYQQQLLGLAKNLAQIVEVLPQYQQAIEAYYQKQSDEQLDTDIEQKDQPLDQPQIEVLEQHGDEYITHNPQNGNHYVVRPHHPEKNQRCECPHTYYRGAKCKHQQAVEKHLRSFPLLKETEADAIPLAAISYISIPNREYRARGEKWISIPNRGYRVMVELIIILAIFSIPHPLSFSLTPSAIAHTQTEQPPVTGDINRGGSRRE